MEKIKIRGAVMSEVRCICDFLINHFNHCNPLGLAYIYPTIDNIEEISSFVSEAVAEDSVLMAYETLTGTLVGVLIGYSMNSTSQTCVEPSNDSNTDQSFIDIQNILNYICLKANVFERFKVKQLFKIEIIAVHQIYRRQNIARSLFESAITLARSRKFKFAITDCVNVYISTIAERLGMECISTVSYDEYNNHIGKSLFVPIPPDTVIKTFIKKL